MKSLKTKFNTLKDLEPNNLHFVKPKKLKNPAIVQIFFQDILDVMETMKCFILL